jgi:hypothetical protein
VIEHEIKGITIVRDAQVGDFRPYPHPSFTDFRFADMLDLDEVSNVKDAAINDILLVHRPCDLTNVLITHNRIQSYAMKSESGKY